MDCHRRGGQELRGLYQIGALKAFARIHGAEMVHVKPHGNLYLTAVENETVARAIAQAIRGGGSRPQVRGPGPGPRARMMTRIGKEEGLKVVYEAFPDRAYTPEGTLVSRREPGAVIKDPQVVAERALLMAREGKVVAADGTEIPLQAETLCVHGDNPSAVDLVRSIKETLEAQGVAVKPMGEEE